jgi:hypothetical protein
MADVSRYHITNERLVQAARALQVGQGVTNRIASADATAEVVRAEDWAEGEVSGYVGVPIPPVRAPGQAVLDLDNLTDRNFPNRFVRAVVYFALSMLLHSEFSENAPNQSDYGQWAEDEAYRNIEGFIDEVKFRPAGGGRVRNVNSFVPPMLGPREPRGGTPG